MKQRNICFYSGVRKPEDFDIYPWYATDVRVLGEMGFDVHVSKGRFDIPLRSDLYMAWWPTSGILPLAVARSRRKPFILIAGGDDVVTELPGFGYWERSAAVRRIIKTTVAEADHVIAVSQHARVQAEALGAKRASVVYNAIDVDTFVPSAARGRDLVCIVAELSPYYLRRKPVDTLIRALPQVLARHPSTRLLVIGSPAEGYPGLQRVASDFNVTGAVQFLGRVSREEKLERLQSAFAYVQPTIHEAFGVAIAEAMSCGVPVITSPAGAVPEVVGDCGLFADPHDADGFARQMLYLLDHPDLAAVMGRRARERIVSRFTIAERRRGLGRVLETD